MRKKERKKRVWNIFASLHIQSIRIYLQLCTRCTRFLQETLKLYEKVFRADERATLGKIFRGRHHVARFPNLENHVQPTCPFGRVLVPQHPITLNSNFVLQQLRSFHEIATFVIFFGKFIVINNFSFVNLLPYLGCSLWIWEQPRQISARPRYPWQPCSRDSERTIAPCRPCSSIPAETRCVRIFGLQPRRTCIRADGTPDRRGHLQRWKKGKRY